MIPNIGGIIAARFSIQPNPALFVLVFFSYSFLGYVLECIVLTFDKRHLVVNRGFVNHLPFCIIYGFGAMLGYAALAPFRNEYVFLFVVGALSATVFEYAVAKLQIRIFGDFWWDYTDKPFNYKGILCLESTVGWGLVALIVICYLHRNIVGLVSRIPADIANLLALAHLSAYVIDFILSARAAMQRKQQDELEKQAARVWFKTNK